jgi:hypothetical protein
LPRMEVRITNIKEVLNGIKVNPTYMYNCGSERSAVNFIIYDSHVQKYLVIGILKSWQVMMSMPFSLSAKHVCHISGQYSEDIKQQIMDLSILSSKQIRPYGHKTTSVYWAAIRSGPTVIKLPQYTEQQTDQVLRS